MEADEADSFGFHRMANGSGKKTKKRSRLNQRQRRNLKKQRMAETLQPEIVILSDDEYISEPEDLRAALEAKKLAQASNVMGGGKIVATETGGLDDLRSFLKGRKSEQSNIMVDDLTTSLDELEPGNLVRQGSLEISLAGVGQASQALPRVQPVVTEAGLVQTDEMQASADCTYVLKQTAAGKVDRATSTADLEGPATVDGVLWRRVVNKAKQALKEIQDDPDDVALNLWTGTNAEQRDLWSRCWPLVDPETLDALIDETPRYSTMDTHIDMSIKLALAVKVIPYATAEKATALMESSRWHMKLANYIDKCNFDKAKPADDHACNYDDGVPEGELVIGVSAEDKTCLGLSPDRITAPALIKPSWYNPLNDKENDGILWVSSELTRLVNWMAHVGTKYEIKSMEDATETFAHPGDDLNDVNVHASTSIKLMKMREIVSGKEIKDLLFMAALSHLKVVSSFHPKREGRWRTLEQWPSSKFH